MPRYHDVLDSLRTSYDNGAEMRDGMTKQPWKVAERRAFRERLAPGARLLEIGAGSGQDGAWFAGEGLSVTAVDLSPAMIALCRAKGLDAHVRDFLDLGFPAESFDAVHAMNCLLHVPNQDLPAALAAIREVLRPGGLFFLGVYGRAESSEGPLDGDEHEPPRFFSFRGDEQLLAFVTPLFEVVDFHTLLRDETFRFQSLTLRRPG